MSSLKWQPLATRMRPRDLHSFWGQEHILQHAKPLYQMIEQGQPHSMVLWGPPGTGKTTLAHIIAEKTSAHFITLSAVLAGVKDIRLAVEKAEQRTHKTILFVDEVHRFNKSQQDAFLPHIESGTIVFIGATTENPSFELNNALLSRVRVYKMRSLTENALFEILNHTLSDKENGLGNLNLQLSESVKNKIVKAADGDGRRLLNLLEIAADLSNQEGKYNIIDDAIIEEALEEPLHRFDKQGDLFYEQISALHKSVRGSSPDAALYWYGRMLDGGCDPIYIARRLVRMASEDIGNADPRALEITLNAWQVYERLGSPEGELALAQAVVYMSCAAKSNAVYLAVKAMQKTIKNSPSYDVPMHLRNAPTQFMKESEYGKGYRYTHDEREAYAAGENYFPEELQNNRYYFPVNRGLELKIREKLAKLRDMDKVSTQKRYT